MQSSNDEVLKRFMKEFFPFSDFRKAGIFTKEMKGDHLAQSERIRKLLGYKTIYEYGAKEIRCHLSFSGERPESYKEFVTIIPSIYQE